MAAGRWALMRVLEETIEMVTPAAGQALLKRMLLTTKQKKGRVVLPLVSQVEPRDVATFDGDT